MSFMAGLLSGQSAIFKTVVISSNQVDWNLITAVFGGSAPFRRAVVDITVNAGVDITSSSNGVAAMDLTGLPANSLITLTNNGNIYGTGGDGGDGEGANAL